jgi:voltage-gated potassium channel
MKRLLLLLLLVLVVVITGIIGYSYIEGWPFMDSFYMTIITLTTTGFNEVHQLSYVGRLFTIVILVLGISTVGFAATVFSKMIIEGEFEQIYGRKRVEKVIRNLNSHAIICGYGKTGKNIAKGFAKSKFPFVIIEGDENVIEQLEQTDYLYIKGDAIHNDVLKKLELKGLTL